MRYQKTLAFLTAMLLLAALPSRADELIDKGRDIFQKNQHAVVTVEVVQKFSGGGHSSEIKQDLTGTVIAANGLTVLALSACDPTDIYHRMGDQYKSVEIEVTDIKILLSDGTELASEIVLRDKDLDLAFIRPKVKPAAAVESVDLAKAATAQVLDQVITLNRLKKAAGRAYSASVERISAVVQKPRTFYIPDSNMTSTTLGSPAFALNGNLLGVFVMRAISSQGSNNRGDNFANIILPTEDIQKAALQAPEVKPEEAKKAAKPETKTEAKPEAK